MEEERWFQINLYLGCSLEAMKKMEDNTYDLAIVDPPYGIGETGEVSRNRIPGPQYKKNIGIKAHHHRNTLLNFVEYPRIK